MIVASAPGKVNLQLLVGKPDARGYHPLYSIFETLNVRERVAVQFIPEESVQNAAGMAAGVPIIVRTVGGDIGDLDPQKHLAWRAAKALLDEAETLGFEGVPSGRVLDIEVTKSIPVAGGMAGGSADAAATLVATDELLGLKLERERLHEIGRSLGADVPACLEGGISLGLGYGDHMQRLDREGAPRHHWVMCTMEQGLSTPAVFKHFDARGRGRDRLPEALRPADLAVLREAEVMREVLQNDLEESARELHPTLAKAWKAVEEAGPLAVMLSGSGPTIAALASSEEHAFEIAKALERAPEIAGTIVVSGPSDPAKVE